MAATEAASTSKPARVGPLLREWRRRRRLSQMDLALEAGVSTRHLSFVETGRAVPSPDMVLQLAEQLEVPHRERNRMLLAAGYAPVYRERGLDEPEMEPVREALDLVLKGHEPYPALVVDRGWNMVAANQAVPALLAGIAPALLEPPVNVLRASLHPDGLAPRIANLGEWRGHLLDRLGRQIALTGDEGLADLYEELAGYPAPEDDAQHGPAGIAGELVVTLRLRTDAGELAFFSTVTTFGTAVDITVSELAVEAFFPATPETAIALRSLPAG
jgi:transcriptional regulator with XRE-family HTH domain